MNAVTGVGAPSYTSGVQKWNGTAATLKPIAVMIITSAIRTSPPSVPPRSSRAAAAKSRLPDAPYRNAAPNSRNADARPPSRKYLTPASIANGDVRLPAASTYSARLMISRPRNSRIRSVATMNSSAPVTENAISG